MAKERKAHVSEEKKKAVTSLGEKLKKAKTIMIVSIRNLPSPQLQQIKKDLRGKADVSIVKKSILIRAIDASGLKELEGLKECIESDSAVALSNEDAFSLAGWLTDHRSPVFAKEGQIAEEDISVQKGPTDLLPGPAISELGGVGLQVGVEEGKIAIKKDAVILKKGAKVSSNIASVLQKLDIRPFMIGLNPAIIYDSKNKKIYTGIKIDKKETVNSLVTSQGKARGLAKNIGYYTKDLIGHFLGKAHLHAGALSKLGLNEEKKETEIKKEEDAQENPGEGK